jgi:hypothetical protein
LIFSHSNFSSNFLSKAIKQSNQTKQSTNQPKMKFIVKNTQTKKTKKIKFIVKELSVEERQKRASIYTNKYWSQHIEEYYKLRDEVYNTIKYEDYEEIENYEELVDEMRDMVITLQKSRTKDDYCFSDEFKSRMNDIIKIIYDNWYYEDETKEKLADNFGYYLMTNQISTTF